MSDINTEEPRDSVYRDLPSQPFPPADGKPSYSQEQAVEQIIRSGRVLKDQDNNQTIELTYGFLTSAPRNFSKIGVSGFGEFSDQQKAQAVLAMQAWADVANVTFTEAPRGKEGYLSFGNYSAGTNGAAAFAFMPGSGPLKDGQSWYKTSSLYSVNKTPELNSYGRQTLLHEIGHNLGLSHPGSYNGANGRPSYDYATYREDTRGYSVMSYWSETHTGQAFGGAYASGPLMDDIAAIQKLYGANENTRTGDSVYGFGSNTGIDYLSARSSSDKLVFSVWDAGGNDTLDFSGFTQDQEINLNAGAFSSVGGLVGNVSIAKGVTLENAVGGCGNDYLLGNEVRNWLHGGLGDDELDGGAGNDMLFGEGGNDSLTGGTGDDYLDGGSGADWLSGGEGRDTFVFQAASESTPDEPDLIMDFSSGEDRIDLTVMSQGAGLSFVEAFTGQAGQAVLSQKLHHWTLQVDLLGDGVADFQVNIVGQVQAADVIA
ncbi:M10 family metallopeptidase C-terminal domain-containing protein [Pseudomonas asplenii]|uniref:M10 family metallopeptidase C-terminal domain-containing protein n=1 Tax=Pseudomonas asplenii TaxID=53407 RepID=UPI00036EB074|nr:M10 family metallopeptidase C-terminal domain-containing protein [Pseudomonas fuscovaginae]